MEDLSMVTHGMKLKNRNKVALHLDVLSNDTRLKLIK